MAEPTRSRTLILPGRNTVGLAAVIVAMWYAGVAQSNGAAHLLCFLLASLAAISTVHAWGNLRGLRLQLGRVPPGFAGDELALPVIASASGRARPASVKVEVPGSREAIFFDEIIPGDTARAVLALPAPRRGVFREVRLTVTSTFPLGFFTTRRTIVIPHEYCVYPRPTGSAPLPRVLAAGGERREGTLGEGDDFAGVRPWLVGESQRHIDWKAAARGLPLLTKQWAGDGTETILLDWQQTPGADTEARLAQLAQWVLACERAGLLYGLCLPQTQRPPAHGDAHMHRCLRDLAEVAEP